VAHEIRGWMTLPRSTDLAPVMIMKGGVLLAIRHGTGRTTTDIGFSTTAPFEIEALPRLLDAMQRAIAPVAAENEYDLALRLQSHEVKPPTPQATFPTLTMRLGYASRTNRKGVKRRIKCRGSAGQAWTGVGCERGWVVAV